MRTVEQTEALVVGAGPAGLMAATLLAKSGIHVRIIDREEHIASTATQNACVLHPRSSLSCCMKREWRRKRSGSAIESTQ